MDHPIRLVVTDDLRRSRLTVFFRLLLVIPHFIWLYLWGIAALIVWIIAWFAALFMGRLPQGMHNFLAGYLRYQVHVFAYLTLAANPYPPFSGTAGYPVTVEIASPERQRRLGVFFRGLLAIPALIFSYALNFLTEVVALFAWFVALFMGRIPEGMRNVLAFSIRYHAQTQGYMYLLTSKYPSFNVGLDAAPANTN
jgi:Domain of unknown function (DUF4389)